MGLFVKWMQKNDPEKTKHFLIKDVTFAKGDAVSTTKQYWSGLEGIFCCLIDRQRTVAFQNAIKNTIRQGDVVVDCGAGTGILSMIACQCGAKKVYAIESDNRAINNLRETFKINGYKKKITLIEGDVRSVVLREKVDVIIAEMVATGLIEELQIPAMNNIHKFANPAAKVVLNSLENYVDLVANKNKYYGYKLNVISYEYPEIRSLKVIPLTPKYMYRKVDFSTINNDNVVKLKMELTALKDGIINGLRISSRTTFYDGAIFDSSSAYCFPVILPLQDILVKEGERCLINLSYRMCEGFHNLKYAVSKI